MSLGHLAIQMVSYSDLDGGAARAAYRTHMALRQEGTDSTLLVRNRRSDDASVLQLRRRPVDRLGALTNRATLSLQRSANPAFHSANLAPTGRWQALDADVVHLHWIGAGAMSIGDIARIQAPVVMTLHDMWAFCGAEHYAPETEARWESAYTRHNRPVGHIGLDVDRLVWAYKRRCWTPMTLIAPSRWMRECAQRSSLMRGWPIHVIPSPLDVETFSPGDQARSRSELGLPHDATILLFGAVGGATDERKGFDLLMTALGSPNLDSTLGVVFGGHAPQDELPPRIPLHWQGAIHNDQALARLYRAADVVVVPSRQEALGQVATEAQACGTPVVAFGGTGVADVVQHLKTGYLAEPFDPLSLAQGITWCIEDRDRNAALGSAARARAVRQWSPSVIARRHLEVYEQARSS